MRQGRIRGYYMRSESEIGIEGGRGPGGRGDDVVVAAVLVKWLGVQG